MWRCISFFCGIIGLTGCAFFCEPKYPPVKVTNHWTVPTSRLAPVPLKNLACMAWWKRFKDPTLNHLMEKALRDNDSLNRARAHIEAAQGEYKRVRYQWIPTLTFLGGYSKNPMYGYPGFFYAFVPAYSLNIIQQFAEQKRAKYQVLQAKMTSDAVKLTVIAQLTASYFTYQAEVERRQLLKNLAKDMEDYANIRRQEYEVGLVSDIEPQLPLSEVAMVHGRQEIIERNIVVSRNTIHYLLEEEPGSLVSTRRFSDLNTHVLIPKQLPLTVLANRPDVIAAEMHLRAANAGVNLAYSELLPDTYFDFWGGKMAGNSRYSTPKIPLTLNDQLLSAPILKLAALGDIARQKGLSKASYYEYVDTVLNALKNITNALSTYEHLTKKLQQTEQARHYVADAYQLKYRLYKGGIISYEGMLSSKLALDRMDLRLNRDKLRQLLSIVYLYEALAGGYRLTPVAEKTSH